MINEIRDMKKNSKNVNYQTKQMRGQGIHKVMSLFTKMKILKHCSMK